MRKFLKLANGFATVCIIILLLGAGTITYVVHEFSKDLPDYKQLSNYEPPVSTRVYAGDGSLLAEYSQERRVFLPIDSVPPMVIGAFLAAEDKRFYKHYGVDPEGVMRALRNNFLGGGNRQQGGSTITQQVAKNFLLTREKTYSRKIKEMLLALRMERIYSKNKILELYLNEIYLGFGNYGVAAAALNYFGKAVSELTPAQAAYLASLPKAPSNYNPFKRKDAAIERRNWVLDRMVENGFIPKSLGEQSKKEPINVILQTPSPNTYVAGYFAEEIRREIVERYGDKALYSGGLFVRATLDPRLQVMARKALVDGLVRYDEARGWRGPVKKIPISAGQDWGFQLAEEPYFNDVNPWTLGVVLSLDGSRAVIGLRPERKVSGELSSSRETGFITQEGVSWTRKSLSQALHIGDVVYVEPSAKAPKTYRLRQLPEISGAIVSLNPQTGRVLAMVGGFSFDQSEFNRATQALRQLGSAFKPFVYGAALDNGYTPSTTFLDGPITITVGREVWSPRNYDRKFRGFQTMRYALERSLNLVTIRVARDIGMPLVADYAKRFGLYDDVLLYLPMALGAGETTLLRASGGYAMFANGGHHIKPTLVDYVQDRWGRTIYRHDERTCKNCNQAIPDINEEPVIISHSERVMDPLSAYQVVSILQGVVERGTAQIVKSVGRPLAGKTGTTNEAKDVWFIGFTPNMVTGVFMGYDKPRSLGPTAVGSRYAAPIFRDFMTMALEGEPILPFPIPEGIKLIRVNAKTGVASSGPGSILEAFKPGTLPPGRTPKGLIEKVSEFEDSLVPSAEANAEDVMPPPAPPSPNEDGAY